ncbi:response regulator transcription factor [Fusobacterium mortiferum]|jgi:two-component system response regulator ArlR|uniref:DNA-binding response regulator n=3 Tax=Fusobacterium mortiferum TaxID=850 RepID=A0A414Q069_FUSMR|nr:response regulator transcription factor [Fusobacterium mortiferum]AVQ18349.1 DNA-binding response regulator [Fusobacterium mortiferum ATCC 9817]EEO34583.1 response regulator ArlR [Fusobacterium mortiferum ATCC 9817]MCF2626577.1 response regulator transcription factor [Fusobacterium mortiferum]MCI6381769.1 response regulator transcription factor [Fusobacterium mortiferum]MCI7188998.1 response regulator transcription factor [Fusobacterium mortiferum]
MKNILIIEDDLRIRRILQLELEHEGYLVSLAKDGKEGLEKAKLIRYDLILLDLMLPEISGEEVCKELRKNSDVPIIVLTAKENIRSKVELLDMGADDYITKPFNIEELFARMRVALRNKKDYQELNQLKYEDLVLDIIKKELIIEKRKVSLTKTEYRLLELFILNREITISREKIITEIWGYDFEGEEKIVDVYLNSLRKKIEAPNKKYIQNIRGFGYMLKLKRGDSYEKDI